LQRTELRRFIRLIVVGSFAVVASGLSGLAIAGRYLPDGLVVDLHCPFQSGVYLVVNGGSQPVVNAHMATLEPTPRFVPWRGQSYGVDLVRLDSFGRRASGFASSDPADYHIHGQLVTAPCAGTVVSVASDRPDMTVAIRDPDRSKLAGNHVLIACGGIEVLLAHLLRDSLRVTLGSEVTVGEPLGLVGNSGNTDEPHLHLSAQRRSVAEPFIGGTPVWLTIEGRFLVRNDRLSCDPQ
jgi:murein DD-endopeptidase MepM/ murein hydrolase activator NlpD